MTQTITLEQNKRSDGKRMTFLDVLRVAATCAVVLLHTVTGVRDTRDMSEYPVESMVFLIIMDCVTWCVPVFIMISGYLFLDPEREIPFFLILKKYCRRIILALFLFGVPYACLELIMQEKRFRPGLIWEGVIKVCRGQSWAHMWYLYLILLLYLLTPALKVLMEKCPRSLIYVIMAMIFVGGSILPFVKALPGGQENIPALPAESIYLFYYLCGGLSANRKRKKEGIEKQKHSAEAAAVLTIIWVMGMMAFRIKFGGSVQRPYNYPFTAGLSLLIFELAGTGEGIWRRQEKYLKEAGGFCFTIYLVHPVFVNLLYKFFDITPLAFPVGISLPVFFLGIMAASVAAAWVLRKIPLLAKYVL